MPLIEDHSLAPSNHLLVHDRALSSHVEIKAGSDPTNAVSQLKTWSPAGFRKQERLWKQRERRSGTEQAQFKPAPQPPWLWEKDRVQLLIAVMDVSEDTMYLTKTFSLSMAKIRHHCAI